MPKQLLLIAHAPSANTQTLLEAMRAAGAAANPTALDCRVLAPFDATAAAVQQAAGVLLFTPENFGYMSGALKDFFDRIYYPCLERTQGLPYCLCVRAGQASGSGAIGAVTGITTGLRWREVQPPLVFAGLWQPDFSRQAAEFTAAFALGLDMGIF